MIYVDGDRLDALATDLLAAADRLTDSDGLRLRVVETDAARQALAELLVKNALSVLNGQAYDLVERRGEYHLVGGLTFGKG